MVSLLHAKGSQNRRNWIEKYLNLIAYEHKTECLETDRNRIIEQTIAFLFVQRIGLVQTIAVSNVYVKFYMYHG